MNIFVTSECPFESARNLDDKRVIKMILESAQILSTAMVYHGLLAPYKATHINHPCNIWARDNKNNFKWLVEHFDSLCAEYTNRYNKMHKSYQYLQDFEQAIESLPDKPATTFVNCAANQSIGISYKHYEDVTEAYMAYLCRRWELDKRKPTWYGVV